MQENEEVVEVEKHGNRWNAFFIIISILSFFLVMYFLTGCTLSFQNVMTSGTASDVVDSDPSTDTTANPNISIPAGI